MKKIIIMVVISLFLVSLVSAQEEVRWDEKGVQTLTFWEKLKQNIGFTTGATIPSGCSTRPRDGEKWIFDASKYTDGVVPGVGKNCQDGDYMAVFSCGLTSKYTSSAQCNYGGAIREGYEPISNLLVNPSNRYMYFCYDCEVSTPIGYCSSPFGSNGDYDCVSGIIKKCVNDKWATYQTCESGKCLYENVLRTSPSNLCMPKYIISDDCPNYNLKNSEIKCEGVTKIKCMDGIISIIGSCQVDIGETCTTNNICKTGYCNPTTKKCEVEPEIKEEIEEGKICCKGAGFGLDENNQLAFEWQYKLLDKCEAPFVTEADNGYCSGEKEAEPLPEADEETEEGAPDFSEETEKCSVQVGGYCKPSNQAGLDDSGQNNICETGWCQDVSGIGGRCAKVGTFSDGKKSSGYEPHKDCAASEEEYTKRTGLDLCKWTKGFPDWFGTECATAYSLIIIGLVVLIILPNLRGGRR